MVRFRNETQPCELAEADFEEDSPLLDEYKSANPKDWDKRGRLRRLPKRKKVSFAPIPDVDDVPVEPQQPSTSSVCSRLRSGLRNIQVPDYSTSSQQLLVAHFTPSDVPHHPHGPPPNLQYHPSPMSSPVPQKRKLQPQFHFALDKSLVSNDTAEWSDDDGDLQNMAMAMAPPCVCM